MQAFKAIFFKKKDGSCPVEDFLMSIDEKMRIKLAKEILLLSIMGMKYVSHTQNICEMVFMNYVLSKGIISAEYCTFSMWVAKLF